MTHCSLLCTKKQPKVNHLTKLKISLLKLEKHFIAQITQRKLRATTIRVECKIGFKNKDYSTAPHVTDGLILVYLKTHVYP